MSKLQVTSLVKMIIKECNDSCKYKSDLYEAYKKLVSNPSAFVLEDALIELIERGYIVGDRQVIAGEMEDFVTIVPSKTGFSLTEKGKDFYAACFE